MLRRMSEGAQSLRSVHTEEDDVSGNSLSIYSFNREKGRWCRVAQEQRQPACHTNTAHSTVQILTWNLDFAERNKDGRLRHAIDHMQRTVFGCILPSEAPPPCCLLLQEIEADVIPTLLAHEWVRTNFHVTPISKWNWPGRAHYGNITLVSRSVPVLAASSLVFQNSHMARNALMVDLQLCAEREVNNKESQPGAGLSVNGEEHEIAESRKPLVFRIANVHLESLPQGALARPEQLALVAQALRETHLAGGIVCGDMNAISKSEHDIPKGVGLRDAYTGDDDSDSEDNDGHTWGYQPELPYPPGRLDKVLYTPSPCFSVAHPQHVGAGLKTPGGEWVSDHYGLLTTVCTKLMDSS